MATGQVVAATDGGRGPAGGIRPFRLAKDLGEVVRLIERAFGTESAEERLSGRDVATLRLFAPLIGALGTVAAPLRDLFAGFVWERNGRIIGNITISRLGGDASRWMIGNVAVDPGFRRLGIARRLTEVALAEIEQRGGEITVLDVRADNEPAYALYRSLGFERVDTVAELRRGPSRERPSVPPNVRPLRAREWRSLWWLLRTATPPEVQRYTPIQEHQVLASVLGAGFGVAGRVLTGSQSSILVVEEAGTVTGAAEIELHGGETPHRIKLTIHPSFRGGVERSLVSGALVRVVRPLAAVRVEVRSEEEAAGRALAEAGFQPFRVLDRLVLAHAPR